MTSSLALRIWSDYYGAITKKIKYRQRKLTLAQNKSRKNDG